MDEMDSTAWLRQLEQINESGTALQGRMLAAQAELDEILVASDSNAVTVELDAAGVISSVEIADGTRTSMSADALAGEVNRAITLAGIAFRADAASAADGTATGINLGSLLGRIFSGGQPEQQKVANDFKTLSIVLLGGSVIGVELDSRWVASTPERLIAEEIVRMARIASEQF
jgi:DNA-binding protein YbaB